MQSQDSSDPITKFSFKNQDNSNTQQVLLKKLEDQPISLSKDEKIAFITYHKFTYRLMSLIFYVGLFPPIITFTLIEVIDFDLIRGSPLFFTLFLVPFLVIPIIWKKFQRLLEFQIAVFTNNSIHLLNSNKKLNKLDWQSNLNVPYNEILLISFFKKRMKKDTGSIQILFGNSSAENLKHVMLYSLKNFISVRRAILSILNENINATTNQATNQTTNQTINQTINQTTNQATNQSIYGASAETIYKTTDETKKNTDYDDNNISGNSSNHMINEINRFNEFKRLFPSYNFRRNSIYKTSDSLVQKIQRKKKIYKIIAPIFFISLITAIIMSVIFNHNGQFIPLIIIEVYFLAAIPFILYSDYKKINHFENTDNSAIKILNNRIEIQNETSREIKFTYDMNFQPLGLNKFVLIKSKLNKLNTLKYTYLAEKSETHYIGSIDNLFEFYFNMNIAYMQFLRSMDYFVDINSIQKIFLLDDLFNSKLIAALDMNSIKYRNQMEDVRKEFYITHFKDDIKYRKDLENQKYWQNPFPEFKTPYQQNLEENNKNYNNDNFGIQNQIKSENSQNQLSQLTSTKDNLSRIKLQHSIENFKQYIEKDEEVLYVFHPKSIRKFPLSPKLAIFGILLILFICVDILAHTGKLNISYTLISIFDSIGIFGVIVGTMLFITITLSSIFQFKNQYILEMLLTNKKIIIILRKNISTVMYSNIKQILHSPLNIRTEEYQNVDLFLKNEVKTSKYFIIDKYTLYNVSKESPIFSIFASYGINIYANEK